MPNRYKYSRQREEIYKILKSTKSHPTAQWIYERARLKFPTISLGTVYRNLNILLDQKRVIALHTSDDFDHYDANVIPHYHIICQQCKKVEDLDTDLLPVINDGIVSTAESVSGYRITNHAFNFVGLCADCQVKLTEQDESESRPKVS